MKNIQRFTPLAAIVVCGFFAFMEGVSGFHAESLARQSRECVSQRDTATAKIEACKGVLDECAECGILDEAGVARYHEIAQHPSVAAYVELIGECEDEDNFDDTVGSGDAYYTYQRIVK